MSSLVANTIYYDHVYLASVGNQVGPMEANGPLGAFFDGAIKDLYGGQSSFEKAERYLVQAAVDSCLKKLSLTLDQVDLLIGGDLLNQIITASYCARDFQKPFIGVYGACSTSALSILNGAMYVDAGMKYVLAYTSSHQATAERQYRYPLEYGIQKKPTTTYTATGSAAFLLTEQPTAVRLKKATIGQVVDYGLKDANDMGSAMAPAAYRVIQDHLKNTHTSLSDYDVVITGDLSTFGLSLLKQMFKEDHEAIERLQDCGMLLYDTTQQAVFMGGSGCACSGLVFTAFLYRRLLEKKYRKVLFVPTGAMFSPTATNQKESIPGLAYALEWEAVS